MPWIRKEGNFNDNTILIDAFQTGSEKSMGCVILKGKTKSALIDTSGPVEAAKISQRLKIMNLAPDILILTHSHWDHAGGASIFQEKYPSIEIMAGKSAVDALRNNIEYNEAYLNVVTSLEPVDNIIPVKEGEIIDLGDLELKIIETPGHTNCSISILDNQNKTLFLGDSLGYLWTEDLIMPPIMPPDFSQEKLMQTFEKIQGIDFTSIGLAHYGFLTEKMAQDFPERAKSSYKEWSGFLISTWENLGNTEDVIRVFIEKLHGIGIYDPGLIISHEIICKWMIIGLKSANLIH